MFVPDGTPDGRDLFRCSGDIHHSRVRIRKHCRRFMDSWNSRSRSQLDRYEADE